MISISKASDILNYLTGKASLSKMTSVYLGICSGEPTSTGGIIGEPASMDGYARKQMNSSDDVYFGDTTTAITKNIKDIIMFVAKEDMGKQNYWFFSTQKEGGTAFAWGKIINRNTNEPGLNVALETVPVFYNGELQLEITASSEAAASA